MGRPLLRRWVKRHGIGRLHPRLCTNQHPSPTLRRPGHGPSIALRRWTAFRQFWPPTWSFLKDPLLVLGDVSNPHMIFYELRTSQTIFIQNELVKVEENRPDVQGWLKAYLSNALDVLFCLTSKLNKIKHTACTYYIKSINEHRTSFNTL